jgi:hypothetical protein
MNLIENIRDFVMGSICLFVIGLTCYLFFGLVMHTAPAHRLEMVFLLPLHLHRFELQAFYALWIFYWLGFWRGVSRLAMDSTRSRTIYQGSLGIIVVLGVAWYYYSTQDTAVIRFATHNSGMKTIGSLAMKIIGCIFPFICLGTWLTLIAEHLGYGSFDPIARQLGSETNWGRSESREIPQESGQE